MCVYAHTYTFNTVLMCICAWEARGHCYVSFSTLLLLFRLFLFDVYEHLPACMSMQHVCACCSQRPEGLVEAPGTGIMHCCKPLTMC